MPRWQFLGWHIGTEPLGLLIIKVPSKFHGRLIGSGRSKLDALEAKHGCNMHLPRRGGGDNVELEGPPAKIGGLKEAIEIEVGQECEVVHSYMPEGGKVALPVNTAPPVSFDPAAVGVLNEVRSGLRQLPFGLAFGRAVCRRGALAAALPWCPRGRPAAGLAGRVPPHSRQAGPCGRWLPLSTRTWVLLPLTRDRHGRCLGGGVRQVLFFELGYSEPMLERFLDFFRSAAVSIDVCVFSLTHNAIAHVLLCAHKRGVKVRLISDDDQASERALL